MNKALIAVIAAFAVSVSASAPTTVIYRTDMSRGNQPYQTAALLLANGWEAWFFGANDPKLLDIEIGRLYTGGKNCNIGGYGTYWPDSGKLFLIPWVSYNDKLAGGDLSLNLGWFAPLNGGPRITFCDESTLLWHAKKFDYGLVLSHWHYQGSMPTTRIGPTVRFNAGNVDVKINYQPVFLSGNGSPTWRLEITHRF